MRLQLILVILATFSQSAVFADTLLVTGIALFADKSHAPYQNGVMSLHLGVPPAGKKPTESEKDVLSGKTKPTTENGAFSIIKTSVDRGTPLYVIIYDEKHHLYGYSEKLSTDIIPVPPGNAECKMAKQPDVLFADTVVNVWDTSKPHLAMAYAIGAAKAISTINSLKVKSGEMSPFQANESATSAIAEMLPYTEAPPGTLAAETLSKVYDGLKKDIDPQLADTLPLLRKKDEFLKLQERPEFKHSLQTPRKESVFSPFNGAWKPRTIFNLFDPDPEKFGTSLNPIDWIHSGFPYRLHANPGDPYNPYDAFSDYPSLTSSNVIYLGPNASTYGMHYPIGGIARYHFDQPNPFLPPNIADQISKRRADTRPFGETQQSIHDLLAQCLDADGPKAANTGFLSGGYGAYATDGPLNPAHSYILPGSYLIQIPNRAPTLRDQFLKQQKDIPALPHR